MEWNRVKRLAEFSARRREKIKIIFHRDMRVGKNTSQTASVEFCRKRQDYARSRLQIPLAEKTKFFRQLKKYPPAYHTTGRRIFTIYNMLILHSWWPQHKCLYRTHRG